MKMYRVWLGRIEECEVLRVTNKQVVFATQSGVEQREAKVSDHCSWHETWEEAKAKLVNMAQMKVDYLRRQLEVANSKLGNAKGLKAPANARIEPGRCE